MHTLFDFMTSVNAIQYGLALLFIIGFVLFNEILRPKPFDGLVKAVVEDVRFIRAEGKMKVLAKKVLMGPVYLGIYLAALPLLFVQGMAVLFGKGVASVTYAGWSPVRAYFAGRKSVKKVKKNDPEEPASD